MLRAAQQNEKWYTWEREDEAGKMNVHKYLRLIICLLCVEDL